MKKLLLIFSILSGSAFAQDDLLNMTQDSAATNELVTGTFKTTRLINVHTLETVGKRTLDFRISHRFGDINSGAYNAFGLDGPASIKLSLEYSFDGRFMFGIGRSSFEKNLSAFAKYRLLRQTTDDKTPLSITFFTSVNSKRMHDPGETVNGYDKFQKEIHRLAYASEMIIGRKFSKALSLQTSIIHVHHNLVDSAADDNDMFAIGVAGRFKITKRIAISGEYVARISDYSTNQDNYHNSAGVGIDIETGGHVFQMHLTNSFGLDETQFVPYTATDWSNGGIRLGFNISRVFVF